MQNDGRTGLAADEKNLQDFPNSGDSITQLVAKNGLDIRDFVVLSIICKQGVVSFDQLVQLIGLSPAKLSRCLDRLEGGDFTRSVESGNDEWKWSIRPTDKGLVLSSSLEGDVSELPGS